MEHPMKAMIVAAAAALSLGIGAAYAQGLPAGSVPPVYGSQAFSDHRNDKEVHFLGQGTVFAKIFGHSNDQAPTDRTAELKVTSAKGG
jgi:hypothetical protein